MIDLYSAGTPNGYKVSIALDELQLPYRLHPVDILKNVQKEPWFLAINPNGRIPAIIDREAGDFAVFESGAILVYLAEKTGRLLPTETKARSVVMQWLMFQMAGVGPMMGQANVFNRYLPEKIPLAIQRYQGECRRLFGVLDQRLSDHEFLAGNYSIADIATWPWVRTHEWSGVPIEDFTHLQRWLALLAVRPAVQSGILKPPSWRAASTDASKGEADREFAQAARSIVSTN